MTTLDYLRLKVDELKKTERDLWEMIKKKGPALIHERLRAFMDANPEIESYGWSQTIPSFNDGDPCTFQVSDSSVELTPSAIKALCSDVDFGDQQVEPWQIFDGSKNPRAKELESAICEMDELLTERVLLEASFGSYATVYINATEFVVD